MSTGMPPMTASLIAEFHAPLSSPNPAAVYNGLCRILAHAVANPADAVFLADAFYPPLAALHLNWQFQLIHPDFDLFLFSELAQRSERTHRLIWLHAVRPDAQGPGGKWIAGLRDPTRPHFRHRVLLLCHLAVIADRTFASLGAPLLEALLDRAGAELAGADAALSALARGARGDPLALAAYAAVLDGVEILAAKQAANFPEPAVRRLLAVVFANPDAFAERLLPLATQLLAAPAAACADAGVFRAAAAAAVAYLQQERFVAPALAFLQIFVEVEPDVLPVEALPAILGFGRADECALSVVALLTALLWSDAAPAWYDACVGGGPYADGFWEFVRAASGGAGPVRRAVCTLLAVLAGGDPPGESAPPRDLSPWLGRLAQLLADEGHRWVADFVVEELASTDQGDIDAVSAGLLAVRTLAQISETVRAAAVESRELRETLEELRPFRQNDEAFAVVGAMLAVEPS
jgi:hypothetical protein